MGLSGRTPTGADTAGFVPEIWSNLIIDAAMKNLVVFDSVDHRWTIGKGKGDTVNIGITNHVDATEVVVGSKASSLDIATGSKKQLVMNQWFEAPIDIDDMTDFQTQVALSEEARREAEYAIRVRVDTTGAALFASLNGADIRGADGEEINDDLLIEVNELLDEADVPREISDKSLILDPSAIADMLKFDKFVAAQYVNIGAVNNGTIGSSPIYGAMIKVTNNLAAASTGAYAVMMHRKAIAAAMQINTPWRKPFEELHQIRYQHEALYGYLEVRDDFGIPFYTRKA